MTTQCGFCFESKEFGCSVLLPCSHSHCLECLKTNFEVNGLVQCPWCRKVYDVSIDNLTSATDNAKDSIPCDVCSKRGNKDQSAASYCTVCCKLFCLNHQQLHDEILEEHHKLSIVEYRPQAKRLETRVCDEHEEFPYIQGCKVCIKLLCIQCMRHPSLCSTGAEHQVVHLETLARVLLQESFDLLDQEEEGLATLFKISSRGLSDFEDETTELLHVLHQQQEKQSQLDGIGLNYETFETEFLQKRSKTKADLTRYMEEEVGTLWSNLSKSRMKIEAQLKQQHQVDIVQGHTEIKNRIHGLMSEELPVLYLYDVMTLEIKEENGRTEVQVVPRTNISISLDRGKTTSFPPKSLTLIQTVDVTGECCAVCTHKGKVYVGGGRLSIVESIDEYSSYRCERFISCMNDVSGVAVCQNRIYTLVNIKIDSWAIFVHDLSGRQFEHWTHDDSCQSNNQLAIVNELVVVPDRSNKRLVLYTLRGMVKKHIACPFLTDVGTYLSAADGDCVVITGSYRMFKLDLTTERIIWTSKDVFGPQGITCYRDMFVLVTRYDSKTPIWILDVRTGALMSKLTDSTLKRGYSNVLDLHVSGDILIVPRSSDKAVLFYQLK